MPYLTQNSEDCVYENRVFAESKDKIQAALVRAKPSVNPKICYDVLDILKKQNIFKHCIAPEIFCNGIQGVTFLWRGQSDCSYIAINGFTMMGIRHSDTNIIRDVPIANFCQEKTFFKHLLASHDFVDTIAQRFFGSKSNRL